jgi:ribonuclease III
VRRLIQPVKLLFKQKKELCAILRKITGFVPGNIDFYETAFIHRSATRVINGASINNERLEYLGDAILNTVVADFLFSSFPSENEGFLTNIRSRLVSRDFHNDLALKLGFDKLIITQTRKNSSASNIYGNAFEAFMGAIYLDKGYNAAKKFYIKKVIGKHVNLDHLIHTDTNYKSRLVEWAQKYKVQIVFDSSEETRGRNQHTFVCNVKAGDDVIGTGHGPSKKEAEQNAAEYVLNHVVYES